MNTLKLKYNNLIEDEKLFFKLYFSILILSLLFLFSFEFVKYNYDLLIDIQTLQYNIQNNDHTRADENLIMTQELEFSKDQLVFSISSTLFSLLFASILIKIFDYIYINHHSTKALKDKIIIEIFILINIFIFNLIILLSINQFYFVELFLLIYIAVLVFIFLISSIKIIKSIIK